jgi:hypothetical protein
MDKVTKRTIPAEAQWMDNQVRDIVRRKVSARRRSQSGDGARLLIESTVNYCPSTGEEARGYYVWTVGFSTGATLLIKWDTVTKDRLIIMDSTYTEQIVTTVNDHGMAMASIEYLSMRALDPYGD